MPDHTRFVATEGPMHLTLPSSDRAAIVFAEADRRPILAALSGYEAPASAPMALGSVALTKQILILAQMGD